MAKSKFYAVRVGHKPGIYTSWAECQKHINGFSGAQYKSFHSQGEAESFLEGEVVVTSKEKKKENYKKVADEAETRAIELSKEPGVISIYTDGSRKQKPNEGGLVFGYGVAIIENGQLSDSFGKADDNEVYAVYENVAGELFGAVEALRFVMNKRPGTKKVVMFYDYEGIGKWATKEWKAKNIMTQRYVKFVDDFRQSTGVELEFNHVKGHVGNCFNEHVDKIAGEAIDKFLAQLSKGGK